MTVIAERTLFLENKLEVVQIVVRLFKPEFDEPGWRCRYQINWPHGLREIQSAGVDPVQALAIALQMIGADIYSSPYHKSGKLYWERPGGGYGFPVVSSLKQFLVGDDVEMDA
ncbi:MAG: DUF6968 family protein [Bosea sp. (in: a-proteobacteria)]